MFPRFFFDWSDGMTRRIIRQTAAALTAAVLTGLLFVIYFAIYGIYPLGAKSIVWCDMEQQAVPLLLHFKALVQQGESIAYSALDAGGMQFYGVYFFFLSNPLSLLVLVSDIPADMLVNLLVVIKLALASGTAALWLRRRVPELQFAPQVLLAVMYGCSGYGLFYYQNLMWLDIMVMLPVLMITLDILLRQADARPYFLALSIMMLLCFYLCYMIVLFLLIYMALSVHYLVDKAQRGRIAMRFWGASIAAAFLTAAVWLPCFLQVMDSARSGSIIDSLMDSWLVNHLDDKLALLGCTAICFAVLPHLWKPLRTEEPVSLRDRALCLLLTLPVLFDPINEMWHTGSYQAFPLRWGMIPILLLLTLAARLLTDRSAKPLRLPAVPRYAILIFSVLLVAGAVAAVIWKGGDPILGYVRTLWVDEVGFFLLLIPILLAAVSYWIGLRLYRARQIGMPVCAVMLSVLFLAEFTLSFHCYMGSAADPDKLFAQTAAASNRIEDEDFYRVRMAKKYAHANMIGALGYPTLSHYTSMTREDMMYGVKRAGYSSYWMEITGTGGTVLTDAIWNIRYLLGQRADFPSWTEQVWSDNVLSIAKSSMTMPGALALDADPAAIASLPTGSRAAVQAYLAQQTLGLGNLVQEYPVTEFSNVLLTFGDGQTLSWENADGTQHTEEFSGPAHCDMQMPDTDGEIRFAFFVKGRQALYFDLYSQTGTNLGNPRNQAVAVARDGRTYAASYPENSNNGLIFLGEAENSYVSVRLTVKHGFDCESFGVFGLDLDKLEQAMPQAQGAELEYSRGVYTVHAQSDAPRTLMLAVPYDESFTATVNGEAAQVWRVNECQTAVQIPAGESEVQLRFHVRGLRAALMLSAAGLLCCLLVLLLRRRIPEKIWGGAARLSEIALALTLRGILLLVYALPVVLCIAGGIRMVL